VEYVAEVSAAETFLISSLIVLQLFAECKGSHSGICSSVPAEILSNIGRILHSVVVRAGLAIITFGQVRPTGR
jgi:hypothetical protein